MLRLLLDSLRRGTQRRVASRLSHEANRRSFLRLGRRPLVLEPLEPRRVLSTVYVDLDAGGAGDGSSWDDAYTDLQSALVAANVDDEIWVAEGIYTPAGDRTVSFNLKTGVDIYGGFAGTEGTLDQRDWTNHVTTLSGDIGAEGDMSDNSYQVVYASNVTDATLDGFTITAGNVGGPSYAEGGGGMYNNSSSPTLTNVTFSGNLASLGGGMSNRDSSPTLINVTFSGNSVRMLGGGMFNRDSSPTLTNVTFSGNSADSDRGLGGGMFNVGGSSTLTNVTFSGNSADDGGGMYNTSSPAVLTNVTFSGNSADGGGGMFNVSSPAVLTNVTFSGNSADTGGGMFNVSSPAVLTNVTFSGNLASHGGGMCNDHCSPTLTNVTFSGNSASYGGGMLNYDSSPTLTNSILWGNTASNGPEIYDGHSSASTVTYSIVEGGWMGADDVDPLFADAAGGDLRLHPGSPAIDAGDNGAVPADAADLDGDGDTAEPTPLDLDMMPRFDDVPSVKDTGNGTRPIVDMGAYEFQNAPPVADDQSVVANEDTPVSIVLTASDPDGDDLWFSIVTPPAHGTLTDFDPATGYAVYEPDADYDGADSFTFQADDGSEGSNVAMVSIAVLSAEEQTAAIITEVYLWVDEGSLGSGVGNGLVSKLDTAIAQLEAGKIKPAINKLEAFENQIWAMVKSGRLSAEEAETLLEMTDAAIHSALEGTAEATDAALAGLDGEPLDDPPDSSLLDDLVSAGSSKRGKGRK